MKKMIKDLNSKEIMKICKQHPNCDYCPLLLYNGIEVMVCVRDCKKELKKEINL